MLKSTVSRCCRLVRDGGRLYLHDCTILYVPAADRNRPGLPDATRRAREFHC